MVLSNPGKELTLDGLSEERGHCLVDFLRGKVWGEREGWDLHLIISDSGMIMVCQGLR